MTDSGIMSILKENEIDKKNLEKKTNFQRLLDYFVITVGAFLYAVAVSLFLDPNNFAPGGVTGVSIILSRFVNLETGTLIFIINIPIMILGMVKFGFRFILSTIYCTSLVSFFTNLLSPLGAATDDRFLASIVGGALTAVSLGIVFKAGATSGGTDIIIKVLRLKYPYLKTGALFMIMDSTIVAISAFVFHDLNTALYAGVVVVVTSLLIDVVLYGRDGAKLIFIISDYSEAITSRLLEELDVGVTHMDGKGAYSGKEKQVIMAAVKKTLAGKVETIVKEEDPLAFMIISSATEIYGEGYKNIFSEKL
ncbi:MAG: YitT family protein [Acetatifactor sp.]|nr:YitT family protein [Acetatifactor sp.]